MTAINKYISSPYDGRIMLSNVTSVYLPQKPDNKNNNKKAGFLNSML